MHLLFTYSYFWNRLVLIAWLFLCWYHVQMYMKINMDTKEVPHVALWRITTILFLVGTLWSEEEIVCCMVTRCSCFFVSISSPRYCLVGLISSEWNHPTCGNSLSLSLLYNRITKRQPAILVVGLSILRFLVLFVFFFRYNVIKKGEPSVAHSIF